MLSQKLEEERALFDEWWKNAGKESSEQCVGYDFFSESYVGICNLIAWEAWQAALEVKAD